MNTGIKGIQQVVVSEKNSAKTMGSGTLDVFATPAMIALMEETAWKSVAGELDFGLSRATIYQNMFIFFIFLHILKQQRYFILRSRDYSCPADH